MKKTLTINLNNIVFHIDDDAYEMLHIYLADVARHLSDDEKNEVMADIEARIAELFTERLQKNKNVINLQDVEQIIAVLGKPSEYGDTDTDDENSAPKSDKKKSRRFYRDPENAVLGGVGAGIAAYFSWDVTWVRIGLVVAALISAGNMIPVYLLVWIIAPKAVTVSQRLEMQGEDVTVESIKSEINNVKNYVESDKFKQSASTVGGKFVDVFSVILKVVLGFLGAIFGFVGMLLAGILIILLLFFIFEPSILHGFSPELLTDYAVLTPDKAVLMVISLILVVGCPIFMLICWAIRIISGRKDYNKTTSLVVFILWIAGLFMFYSVGAKTMLYWSKASNQPVNFYWENENLPIKAESRNCDKFNAIDVSGIVEIEYTQDSINKLTVSAPENLLKYVKTEVKDGKLKIYTDDLVLNGKIKVYISNDSLFSVEASGASKINSSSKITSSKMKLELSGASRARLDLNVKGDIDVNLSGASYADIDGNSETLHVDVSGASKIEADQLTAKIVSVDASGASHARVFATEAIDADASGAAQIKCDGNPKTVKQSENMGSKISIK